MPGVSTTGAGGSPNRKLRGALKSGKWKESPFGTFQNSGYKIGDLWQEGVMTERFELEALRTRKEGRGHQSHGC